jgi:hypothetical protein
MDSRFRGNDVKLGIRSDARLEAKVQGVNMLQATCATRTLALARHSGASVA